jgi:hypothetical protein
LAAGFLLVFIAGGMTGGLIWSAHAHHLFLGPPHSGALAHRIGERLRAELNLSSDQFAKISPIIEQTASKLETIRIETARRVSQTMADAHQQMAPDLTAEQRAKLAAMEQKHQRHSRHRGFPPARTNEPPP